MHSLDKDFQILLGSKLTRRQGAEHTSLYKLSGMEVIRLAAGGQNILKRGSLLWRQKKPVYVLT